MIYRVSFDWRHIISVDWGTFSGYSYLSNDSQCVSDNSSSYTGDSICVVQNVLHQNST